MGLYKLRSNKDNLLFHIANAVNERGVTPNVMTALGLCLGVLAGAMFALRQIPPGFVFAGLSVFCDVLDGTIARKFSLETSFGRVFDSVSDRICELAVILGALVSGIIEPLGVVAIVGSTTLFAFRALSLTRGLKTDYAMFGRTERLIFILLGLVLPVATLSTLCFVVAGCFGFASSIQIAVFLSRRRLQIQTV